MPLKHSMFMGSSMLIPPMLEVYIDKKVIVNRFAEDSKRDTCTLTKKVQH